MSSTLLDCFQLSLVCSRGASPSIPGILLIPVDLADAKVEIVKMPVKLVSLILDVEKIVVAMSLGMYSYFCSTH